MRTTADDLLRKSHRKLPDELVSQHKDNFTLCEKVLAHQTKDKNQIYSLHELGVYCVVKDKGYKPYEYGWKTSVVLTLKGQVITSVASHDEHLHDNKTLKSALKHACQLRKSPIAMAKVDRGYSGAQQDVCEEVLLPNPSFKER